MSGNASLYNDTDGRSLWARYADASLISDSVRWAKGVFAVLPAAAQQDQPDVAQRASPADVAQAAISGDGVFQKSGDGQRRVIKLGGQGRSAVL